MSDFIVQIRTGGCFNYSPTCPSQFRSVFVLCYGKVKGTTWNDKINASHRHKSQNDHCHLKIY